MVVAQRSGQRACGFFSGRSPVKTRSFDHGETGNLLEYPNVTPRLGMLYSHDKSLIGPLTSTLGIEDMYDLIEVVLIDSHNDRVLAKARREDG